MGVGAAQAVIGALQGHRRYIDVQENGCWAIVNLAKCSDARKDALMAAGAAQAVVGAMQGHLEHAGVQEKGCAAIANLAGGSDADSDADARCDVLMDEGAAQTVVGAMQRHGSEHFAVQEFGCEAIRKLQRGSGARERALRAADAGPWLEK